MNKERNVILVLRDQNRLDVKTVLLELHTALPDNEVIPAVKAACQDYLNTPEGRKQWSDNYGSFNYGDFDIYVGNEFCEPHGFAKVTEETFSAIDDDFNTVLAEPEPLEGHGFTLDEPYDGIALTGEDVDDTMESAMTGCTYWCERVDAVDGYLGEYANEQISRGGRLSFVPFEDPAAELDMEKFRKGLNMWLAAQEEDVINRVLGSGSYDPGQVDAQDADAVIQYALFGEIIYS